MISDLYTTRDTFIGGQRTNQIDSSYRHSPEQHTDRCNCKKEIHSTQVSVELVCKLIHVSRGYLHPSLTWCHASSL